jgi:ATP-dependent helicase HrpB
MTRLVTVPVSRDAADQRRGRAGRQAPGVCYRLWSEHEQQNLYPARRPEILETDLTPLALDLAAWGVSQPSELTWLDAPPDTAFAASRALLQTLGALDATGALTDVGRQMAALPTHPRLARMLLLAEKTGAGALAADLAALLEERDMLIRPGSPAAADLRLRLELLAATGGASHPAASWHHHRVQARVYHRVIQQARRWRRHLNRPSDAPIDPVNAGRVLALAYPDRIAQQSGSPTRFRLRDGRYAHLPDGDSLAESPFLAIAHLDGRPEGARIFLAAPLTTEDIENVFGDWIQTATEIDWDRENERVRSRRVAKLDALILSEKPWPDAPQKAVVQVLLEEAKRRGLHVLNWTNDALRQRQRMAFLHHMDPTWPEVSDARLTEALAEWLGPFVPGLRRLEDLQRVDPGQALAALLSWDRRRELDARAPERIVVPSGSSIAIDYSDPAQPVLAVRLQEVFGLKETPRIDGGRVPLTLHLLSPAHRPVQVTRDLASFWRDTYFEVRKDLRGRYPKHYWPEDPVQAQATRHVRPR